jgi:hypothetical protein
MQATHTAISLELDLDGDSLSGLASVENGEPRPFSGWLGLVSAIEALIANPEEKSRNDRS